jgi:hypothetical protein
MLLGLGTAMQFIQRRGGWQRSWLGFGTQGQGMRAVQCHLLTVTNVNYVVTLLALLLPLSASP